MPPTSRHQLAKNIAGLLIEAKGKLHDAFDQRSLESLANANILVRRASGQARVLAESCTTAGTHQYAANGSIRKALLDAAMLLDEAAAQADFVSDQIDNLFSHDPSPDAVDPAWATQLNEVALLVAQIRFGPHKPGAAINQ